MPYRTDTFRIAMSGPADVSKMTALIEKGALDPAAIVAILVKTEGNGGVNDFTRGYTCATLTPTIAPICQRAARRGGTAGRAGDVRRHRGRALPALARVRSGRLGQWSERRHKIARRRRRHHASLSAA